MKRIDTTSVAGLVVGFSAVIIGQMIEGGSLSSLIQPAAFVIVLGGTLGAILLQSPAQAFRRGMTMARWVVTPPDTEGRDLIDRVLMWSGTARREGLLALEYEVGGQDDGFAQKALQLVVDGAEPEQLRDALDVEITTYDENLRAGAKVWEAAAGYAPTIGILGAVVGLIQVMQNLHDPSKLGAGIATAFVATIYGVGLANLVFLPMANKLKAHVQRLVTLREMMVDGLVGIASGDNPKVIENRLKGYLA